MDIVKMKNDLDSGKVVIGTCVTESRNRQIGRLFANCGFDFLVIETEHSCLDLETVADMIIISKLSGIVPIIKVGDYSYGNFCKYLDMGAEGFILPRIRSKNEVEQVMEWVKYHPEGKRGYSPGAPFCNYGCDIENANDHREYIEEKNKNLFIVIQFETTEAIANVDDILSVEGVDAAIIGPYDLSMSLGFAGDINNKVMKESIEKVFKSCKKNNVIIGTASSNLEEIKEFLNKEMQFIWYANDSFFLLDSKRAVNEIRKNIQD